MDEVLVTPAVSIQVTCDPKGNRMFDVRFAPLPLDMGVAELDNALNRFLRAVDRQQLYYEQQNLAEDLRDALNLLEKYEEGAGEVEATARSRWDREGRRGEWSGDRLSAQERQARDTLLTNIKVKRKEIESLEHKLGRLQMRGNGHAADFSADRDAGRPGG